MVNDGYVASRVRLPSQSTPLLYATRGVTKGVSIIFYILFFSVAICAQHLIPSNAMKRHVLSELNKALVKLRDAKSINAKWDTFSKETNGISVESFLEPTLLSSSGFFQEASVSKGAFSLC